MRMLRVPYRAFKNKRALAAGERLRLTSEKWRE